MEGSYLTKPEAATYMRLCARQIDYLVMRGELPCIKVGRRVLFSKADLDAFMDSCRIPGRIEAAGA